MQYLMQQSQDGLLLGPQERMDGEKIDGWIEDRD
jgi:hypothetical protein